MNWLDIVLIVIGVLAVLWGLRMGLFKAVFLAIGLIVGLVLAGQISDSLAGRLADSVKNESVAAVIAYVAVLLAVAIIALVLASMARKVLSILFLGWIDGLGGLLLGAAAGFLLTFALVAILARLAFLTPERVPGNLGPVETRENIERGLVESALVPQLLKVYGAVPASALGMVPGDYKGALEALKERVRAPRMAEGHSDSRRQRGNTPGLEAY